MYQYQRSLWLLMTKKASSRLVLSKNNFFSQC
uniref:Uncharacterized protein n=1 Tax=Populus trichocarpa TaxID=3694 RepID=A0A3N7ECD8_POPTR